MLFPTLNCQFDRVLLTILAFFAVKQEHYAVVNSEVGPGSNASVFDARSYFADAVPDRPASRHSDWPAELHRPDVRSNRAAIFLVEPAKPFLNRLCSLFRNEECRHDALNLNSLYRIRFTLANNFGR